MALISCPMCGETISDKAIICPHCGKTMVSQEIQEQQVQYSPPEHNSSYSTGMATASMVLGIVSIFGTCILLNWITGPIGLILGIVSLGQNRPGKSMAIAGIVTSAIAILFFVILIVIGLSAELNKGAI